MRKLFTLVIGLVASVCVLAQVYPTKSIRLVAPFSADGPMDTLERALGQHLSGQLAQPVIVDNKPGASTIIGAYAESKAPPAGYTMMATDATASVKLDE